MAYYWLGRKDGLNGPDGMGVEWRYQSYQAPYRECYHLILRYEGQWKAEASTNIISVAGGVEYLCQLSKIIIVRCTQIRATIIAQNIKKSAYNIISLSATTNHKNNDNAPIKISKKNDDTKIEDSHPYISELRPSFLLTEHPQP